jgi:glyoxylase-like metal-dependent hydrolase (beta-lactamase superfamily II)
MSEKQFASVGDMQEKVITFEQIAPNVYAYTTQGDPNSGVIIGEDYVMVVEAQATPSMAERLIEKIRKVTDKPIKYVVLSHYHAVRVLGASAYHASEIIASADTYNMILERGQQDYESEVGRFPRLFQAVETVPGLTWPSITFTDKLTVDLGKRKVEILRLGNGHTKGDSVVWLPEDKVLFSGDLVEFGATPYCGDAQLTEWPGTLDNLERLQATALVPGRGEALKGLKKVNEGITETQIFVTELLQGAKEAVAKGLNLSDTYKLVYNKLKPKFGGYVIFEHCMPFNVTRAFDEASGITYPKIWTAERDKDMWFKLQEVVHPSQ